MSYLIPEKETLEVEFKSDLKCLSDTDLIDAVVAFANTSGGDLYLGVEDDGTVTGCHEKHRDFTRLAAFIANRTMPPVSVRVEEIPAEKPVLLLQVPKSTAIVASSSGKIQRRRLQADGTPENVPMYPYEITTRLSELALLDFSAQPVLQAQYQDFDPLERERLRRIILSYNGEKTLLELSDEELDKALMLTATINNQVVPTVTGMLLIGKVEKIKEYIPTAESAFQAFNGTELTVNESFYLPLLAAIEKIINFIDARNPEQEVDMGLFRMSIPDFDKRAVREAVVNAFAHRDYTQLGRVLVQMDADGMTISNPGGLIEGVTVQNILNVPPRGRNPVLADALKRIGLAERSGRGVDRIFEGSLQYGRSAPDYTETTTSNVKLFIPRSRPDIQMTTLISEERNRTGMQVPLSSLLALNVLKQGRRMALHEISMETNMPESKMRATLERLTESGLIEAIGTGRGRVYVLGSKMYQDAAKYVRQTDIDQLRYSELVLKLAKTQPYITRKDVINLLHITPPQAYRLLQKLLKSGDLICEGKTNGAKYTLNDKNV